MGEGCEPPVDALPGAIVWIDELGDPVDGVLEYEEHCVFAMSLYTGERAYVMLDCGAPIVTLEVPALLAPSITGNAVTLKVTQTADSLDVRVVDELGPIVVVLDGVIVPGVEEPLAWQVEASCGEDAGAVAGHLVVRLTPEANELVVRTGDVKHIQHEQSGQRLRWELRTFAAEYSLDPGVARGAAAIVRWPVPQPLSTARASRRT